MASPSSASAKPVPTALVSEHMIFTCAEDVISLSQLALKSTRARLCVRRTTGHIVTLAGDAFGPDRRLDGTLYRDSIIIVFDQRVRPAVRRSSFTGTRPQATPRLIVLSPILQRWLVLFQGSSAERLGCLSGHADCRTKISFSASSLTMSGHGSRLEAGDLKSSAVLSSALAAKHEEQSLDVRYKVWVSDFDPLVD
jgi:hypothetical protein